MRVSKFIDGHVDATPETICLSSPLNRSHRPFDRG